MPSFGPSSFSINSQRLPVILGPQSFSVNSQRLPVILCDMNDDGDVEGGFGECAHEVKQPSDLKTMRVSSGCLGHEYMVQSVVSGLTTFEDPDLLRATGLKTVLRGAGAIFAESGGSAATYALSEKVNQISVFVSHNWTVSRILKFFVLATYFNGFMAVTVSICTAALTSLFFVVEIIPLTDASDSLDDFGPLEDFSHISSYYGPFASMLLFWIVLLFGHEIRETVGCKKRRLFLDKCCINQTDLKRKQEGITKLAAFVFKSSCMLVCYTDIYLKKLWTMYEVASFLMVHPATNLHVRPTLFPVVILCGTTGSLTMMFPLMPIPEFLQPLTMLIFYSYFVLFTALLRRWARQLVNMEISANEFRVESAACFDERDRAIVESNISLFMRYFQYVGNDEACMRRHSVADNAMNHDELLSAFTTLVRQEVPKAIRVSLGRAGIPYQYTVVLGLIKLSFLLHRAAVSYVLGFRRRACIRLLYCVTCFTTYPLMVALMLVLGKRCVHMQGCREVLYVLVLSSIYFLMCIWWDEFDWGVLAVRAFDSNWYVACLSAYIIALVVTTGWVFQPLKLLASGGLAQIPPKPLVRPDPVGANLAVQDLPNKKAQELPVRTNINVEDDMPHSEGIMAANGKHIVWL